MTVATTLDLVAYYAGLLPKQWSTSPKAVATIEATATPLLMPQVSVQTITFSPVPTSGSFLVTYGANAGTVTINWNDTAAQIQAKLRSEPEGNISGGSASSVFAQILSGGNASTTVFADVMNGGDAFGFDVSALTVTGSIASGTLTVTFTGVYPPAALISVVSSTLMSGGTAVMPAVLETDQTLPLAVKNGFQVSGTSTAVGPQLDIIGKYCGVTRTVTGFATKVTLSDPDFLSLIQMAAIRNNATSDLATIQQLIHQFFSGEILVFDLKNMHMSFYIASTVGSQNLVQAFIVEKLLPAPMGVGVSVIYNSDVTHFFGFADYLTGVPANVTPFDDYLSPLVGGIWLDYHMGVSS
jgi:hypothetical protein